MKRCLLILLLLSSSLLGLTNQEALQILGLDSNFLVNLASKTPEEKEEIRKKINTAYRKFALKWSPDKQLHKKEAEIEEAKIKFQQGSDAKEQLMKLFETAAPPVVTKSWQEIRDELKSAFTDKKDQEIDLNVLKQIFNDADETLSAFLKAGKRPHTHSEEFANVNLLKNLTDYLIRGITNQDINYDDEYNEKAFVSPIHNTLSTLAKDAIERVRYFEYKPNSLRFRINELNKYPDNLYNKNKNPNIALIFSDLKINYSFLDPEIRALIIISYAGLANWAQELNKTEQVKSLVQEAQDLINEWSPNFKVPNTLIEKIANKYKFTLTQQLKDRINEIRTTMPTPPSPTSVDLTELYNSLNELNNNLVQLNATL